MRRGGGGGSSGQAGGNFLPLLFFEGGLFCARNVFVLLLAVEEEEDLLLLGSDLTVAAPSVGKSSFVCSLLYILQLLDIDFHMVVVVGAKSSCCATPRRGMG